MRLGAFPAINRTRQIDAINARLLIRCPRVGAENPLFSSGFNHSELAVPDKLLIFIFRTSSAMTNLDTGEIMLTPKQRAYKYGERFAPNHKGHLMEVFGYFAGDDKPVEGQPELAALRHAHGHVVGTWDAIYSLIEAYDRDPSLPQTAKVRAIAKEAKSAADKTKTHAANSIDKAAEAAARLRTDLRLSLRAMPADAGMDAEIRAYVRTLAAGDATALVHQHLNDYTDEGTAFLRAVAAGPAFLCGLSAQVHELARDRFWQRTKPNALRAVKQYEDAIAKTQKALNALDEHVADFVDFDTADKLNALAVKPLEVA